MIIFNILLVVFGLVFGSFIAAFSYRYPRGISIKRGRSFCDNCKKEILWHDNMPLLSFLILLGKCRNCKKKISWRYPLIELITGVGFLLIGPNILFLILFSVLELIFIVDFEKRIIPDTFIFAGLLISLFANQNPLATSLLSGFLCASFLLLVHLLTRGRGMGLGDVKFAVLGGFVVGLNFSFIWLLLAFLTGATVGSILIMLKKAGLKDKIAFGPFLVIAIPATLIWGQKILELLHW